MIAHTLLVSVVVSFAVAAERPQTKRPDFSGTWQVDTVASKALTEKEGHVWRVIGGATQGNASAAADPKRRGSGPVTIITQSELEIVSERRSEEIVIDRSVHKLDGSLSVNASQDSSSRSTTVWKGNSLVTSGTREIGGLRTQGGRPLPPIQEKFVMVRSLLPDGSMRVESRRTRAGKESVHFTVLQRVKQP